MKIKRILKITTYVVITLISIACDEDIFIDSRDGQKYRLTTIGKQTWMAENLNYQMDDSWCYNDEPNNCKVYGRLYSYQAAQKACPTGWHLPNATEWQILDDNTNERTNLKTKSGWGKDEKTEKNLNGLDPFGFSAVPGGSRYPNGKYNHEGEIAEFWQYNDKTFGSTFWIQGPEIVVIFDDGPDPDLINTSDTSNVENIVYDSEGHSIRCIKD